VSLLFRDPLPFTLMRVGVYIDGFNLYYGGKFLCGPGTPGWRWLDLRALATRLVTNHAPSAWAGATIERIVYCTARISGRDNPTGQREQDVYLRALEKGGIVDKAEYGTYVNRTARAPLATPGKRNRPILTKPGGPVMVKNAAGQDEPDGRFIVSVARREEKGSDVKVAAHLLWDVLRGQPGQQPIESAVVICNDTDLKFATNQASTVVPLGLINPTRNYTAIRIPATVGVGNHWWYQMTPADFYACQLQDPTAGYTKPAPW
jgi:hypothetical protein